MRARVTKVLAFLAIVAPALSPAAAQSPRWLLEGRGGISVATGGYGDSQKTGFDLGAGAGYLLTKRWRAHLDYDFVRNDAKVNTVTGLTGPNYDTHLVMAGLGYEIPLRESPVAVELGAGAGMSRFRPTGAAASTRTSQTYFGVNGEARISVAVNNRVHALMVPQVDVAFADRAKLGESRAWLWPLALGLQYRF
ncbi:MAG TPA: outer membrane beta-barrel protein [Gemmatimonadales bacterium]|jgi:hypothetical protein|nr:outer membrane beta-barrel protein [Gemmatimonadales bacterium]